MNKRGNKISHRTRQKQKFVMKIFGVTAVFSCIAIIKFTALFSFLGAGNAKANDVDIRQVEQQVFSTEMEIEKPELKSGIRPTKNTIFIQKKINESENTK